MKTLLLLLLPFAISAASIEVTLDPSLGLGNASLEVDVYANYGFKLGALDAFPASGCCWRR